MKILAIETSCDDTGIAILETKSDKFKVLSNIVSSQIKIHQKYGGVFPMMAKREHQRNLVPVLIQSLKKAELIKTKKNDSPIIDGRRLLEIKKILKKENQLFENIKDFLKKYEKPDIDLIAVTNGPGLEPCLWVGINFAKALSYFWNIPIVPVNHIEAHILVNLVDLKSKTKNFTPTPKFGVGARKSKISRFHQGSSIASGHIKNQKLLPAICLVVSGGHTQLILMKGIGKYKIIGETRDDAAGECFDKCAKILGLDYPGGPQISALAEISQINAETNAEKRGNSDFRTIPCLILRSSAISLPRPMINSKDYDFSFSGLKTAVLYLVRDYPKSKFQSSQELWNKNNAIKEGAFVKEMCVEIQQAIIDVLIKKTIKAVKDYNAKIPTTKLSGIRDGKAIGAIILGGGVSANCELRSQFKLKVESSKLKVNVIFPEKHLSTDNALMIAITGWFHRNKKIAWQKLKANANLRI